MGLGLRKRPGRLLQGARERPLHATLPARARAHWAGACGSRWSCSRAASTCGTRGRAHVCSSG
eukprot:9158857-Heterocapsa_arctica.AAC.1